jgi:protein-disulfide isomerase
MYERKVSPLILAAAVIALLLVGISAWYTLREPTADELFEAMQSDSLREIRPLQAEDHVLGNPNAPIVFIVYSDFSCPFCKEYHAIVTGLIEQYGKEGAVALVYRNIPFVQLHPESPMYAHSAECVASLSGNTTYWKFVDLFFTRYLEQEKPKADDLVRFAGEVGVSTDAFTECMRSNRHMDRIERDYKEATGIGANASPFTVVIEPDVRRSFEGSRSFVELAGALLSSIQTFEASGLLPLKEEKTSTTGVVFESDTASSSAEQGTSTEEIGATEEPTPLP